MHNIPTWCELVTFHMRILPLLPPDTMRHGDLESLSAMARAVTCDVMRIDVRRCDEVYEESKGSSDQLRVV